MNPSPFRRELNRVRQQVRQNLADLYAILINVGHTFLNLGLQRDVLAQSQVSDQITQIGNDTPDRELFRIYLHPASFQLCQIKDVVDQLQQQPTRLADISRIPHLFLIQIRRFQNLRKSDDTVERRPQLVAHVGQKLTFDLVHLVELHIHASLLANFTIQLIVRRLQLSFLVQ